MDCFDKNEYRILNELGYQGQGQVRKVPDVVILREGKYNERNNIFQVDYGGIAAIVETKKLDIASGFAQATQYQTLVRKTMGHPSVLASTDFRRLWVQDNSSGNYVIQQYSDVKEIAKVVCDSITCGLKSTPILYTDRDYVEFIGASVDSLTQFTRKINKKTLERLTGFFLATTLDAEIGKKKEILEEISKTSQKAAAFIIVNQLFLYYLLSTGPGALFDPLPEEISLSDLQDYFNRVLRKDFEAIFNCRMVLCCRRMLTNL